MSSRRTLHALALSGLLVVVGGLSAAGCRGEAPERPDIQAAPDPTAAPADADTPASPEPNGADAVAAPEPAADAEAPAPPDPTDTGSEPTDPEPGAAVFPDDPFRAERPAAGPVADVVLPGIERFTHASGIEVYLVAQDKLPTVYMSFEFDLGGVDDPSDRVGLASVCLDLFSESTARLDKIAFAEAQADHAVSIWSPAGLETAHVNMRTLSTQLGPALDLLGELLATPGMRAEDFERIVSRRKAELRQQRATADAVARRIYRSLVWGADHPYARVQLEEHLDAITLDDCQGFVKRLRPAGARLWVAGKVTRASLDAALTARLTEWFAAPDPPGTDREQIREAQAASGTIYFVQLDGAVQSAIAVGHAGPERAAEDYEATHLMMQILGGSFASRINMNLREDKGYAYGAFGGFSYRRNGSHLAISASVEGSSTALALEEIAKEIRGMREGGPTAAELRREQEGALLALPAQFATPSKVLDEYQDLVFYGLPLDWFVGHQKRLRALDLAAVAAAAKEHVRESGYVVLVVGDGTMKAKDSERTVLEELERLAADKVFGDGGLVVLDPDGRRL